MRAFALEQAIVAANASWQPLAGAQPILQLVFSLGMTRL